MNAHVMVARRSVFDRLSAALSRFLATAADTSEAMRCAREAERLFALSDDELARRGLTRDAVISHAFARYLAV